jgi:NADH:flavin oxidoreductase / NADH oxidase family
MLREARFDVLFEPAKIGPLTAKNRIFQVPHCNGMDYAKPRAHAGMRGVKAEGGWAVVSTEEVEIHPSTDLSPYIEGRLWDDSDIPFLAVMTEAVHRHGFGGLDRRLTGAEYDRRRRVCGPSLRARDRSAGQRRLQARTSPNLTPNLIGGTS